MSLSDCISFFLVLCDSTCVYWVSLSIKLFLSHVQNELKMEVERRKLGKEMLDYKRKQEEEKTKRLLEERNREKAEEKAARERVKQQIALVTSLFDELHSCSGRNTALTECVCGVVLMTAAHVCGFVLQDRADRAARYAQVQQEAEAARLTALQVRAAEDEAKREATQRERRCR